MNNGLRILIYLFTKNSEEIIQMSDDLYVINSYACVCPVIQLISLHGFNVYIQRKYIEQVRGPINLTHLSNSFCCLLSYLCGKKKMKKTTTTTNLFQNQCKHALDTKWENFPLNSPKQERKQKNKCYFKIRCVISSESFQRK